MSTTFSSESRHGSSWLQFLKRARSPLKPSHGAFESTEPAPSLLESISAWATETPNAAALTTTAKILSYADLEAQSNALARQLQSVGANSEALVAILLERSPEFVIAALAAWKAGAAYLPIDPAGPPERIRLILKDARSSILIHSSVSSQVEFSQDSSKQVDISDRASLLKAYSSQPLRTRPQPSQLAYVIYTSGSTGRPKGVEITHKNLSNLIRWHQTAFATSNADRASLLASPGFDASVWELWPYLSGGASVHIPSETIRMSPRSIRDWLLAQSITISFVPTPIAQHLLSLEWPTETSLRFLLTGADVLQQYPPAGLPFTLVNNYGPTECTVVALSGALSPHQRPAPLPPIGRPVLNTRIFLLDEDLQPVPNGTIGEIFIAGASVGRGYRNDPDLTNEKFIPNPFDEQPSSRLYKTGDLARALPDGAFEFLGRADDQIKIRGYRIEPSEVCAALCKHEAIQTALVVAVKEASDNPFLAAYFVANAGAQVTPADLRKHLQAHLPDYMIPANFVALDSFPLTTNGKIDRSALPAPGANASTNGAPGPRTRTEELLLPIVCTLLKLDRIDPNDNFFLLGGHSLLGAQLLAEIQRTFNISLPLRTVFDFPTISAISAQIDQALASRQQDTGPAPEVAHGFQHNVQPSAS